MASLIIPNNTACESLSWCESHDGHDGVTHPVSIVTGLNDHRAVTSNYIIICFNVYRVTSHRWPQRNTPIGKFHVFYGNRVIPLRCGEHTVHI
jgi:hypothetical protein